MSYVADVSTYLYKGEQIRELGFIKQLEFIASYIWTMRKLCGLEPQNTIIQQEFNLIRKQSNYFVHDLLPRV